MKSLSVNVKLRSIEMHFPVGFLLFESANGILKCVHLNEGC